VVGGAERAQSVRNGLAALAGVAQPADWVMIHDAARPCLTSQDLNNLKRELANDSVGGLLAVPLADTIKRTDGVGPVAASNSQLRVASTVERTGLWRALTPQVFRYGPLLGALEAALAAGRSPTDEAQAIEWQGGAPRLVMGRADNIKVTTSDDLATAAGLLARRAAPVA
jgi:2-C-methyl-D-erythritol 4-phosphate cytidylyltransferase